MTITFSNLPSLAVAQATIAAAVNASLIFKSFAPDTGEDVDGNPMLIETETTLTATCHELRGNERFLEGLDDKSTQVRGRLVSPLEFPDWVTNLTRCNATIDGVTGQLTIYLNTQNPYISPQLGEEFYGIFNR